MKASIRKLVAILSVVTAFAVVMPFAASDACAQQKAANTAKQLIGHWTVVSVKNEQDGKTTEPFGPNPKGLFIFDRSGRYAFLMFRSDLPKFASNNRDKGTPEENKAVVVGSHGAFRHIFGQRKGRFFFRPSRSRHVPKLGRNRPKTLVFRFERRVEDHQPKWAMGGTSTLILKRAR